jgi:hypothetical protein
MNHVAASFTFIDVEVLAVPRTPVNVSMGDQTEMKGRILEAVYRRKVLFLFGFGQHRIACPCRYIRHGC